MPTRIMNWNVQNLGRDKTLVGDTNDLLNNVAKVVVANNIDIFVLLEVNTTLDQTAAQIVHKLSLALEAEQGIVGAYRTYIISPNTGKEFYAFFIRNSANVIPLTRTGGNPTEDPAAVAFLTFAGNTNLTTHTDYFPLIKPDLTLRDASREPRNWTAIRLPCLGLFDVTIAGAAHQVLAIVCCHFAANDKQAPDQIDAIRYISLFNNASGAVGIAPIQAQINGAATPINNIILTGDFNVHYQSAPNTPAAYLPLVNTAVGNPPGINHAAQITGLTHLLTEKDFNSLSRPKDPNVLRSSCYDNFFVSPNLLANVVSLGVVDILDMVKSGAISFSESLDKYAGKKISGTKGIIDYPYYKTPFTGLRKSNAVRNLRDLLIGARLISDHLPVVMQVN